MAGLRCLGGCLLLACLAASLPSSAPSMLADAAVTPRFGSQTMLAQGTCLASAPARTCAASAARQAPQPTAAPAPASASGSMGGGSSGSEGTYIVRFKEYRMAEEHQRRLQQALKGRGLDWRWVPRNNAASKFTTDFGLVKLAEGGIAAAKEQLSKLSFVRDVHPDRQLSQSLLAASPTDKRQPSSPAGGVGKGSGGSSSSGSSNGSGGEPWAAKRPGRIQTRPTFSLEDNLVDWEASRVANDSAAQRRRRLLAGQSLPLLLGADKLWEQGYRGQHVKMGVFDTGVRGDHPHIKNIRERTNWTHEPTLNDGLGHGSFVAGVIASFDQTCPGLAPEVEIYTFRVFTNDQVSYTSWFLDAFNYAIATEMNVVNLSIGGPDYLDEPFVEKVAEITSNGILMISAIGNDGPLYGTLNNPADQNDVIGVGGIDFQDNIASFSSRGMSTWEVPLGYGRAKPDVMAYGREVQGSRINGGCRTLSGTSVASPVVAGAVCLLASVVPEEKRWSSTRQRPGILNPASMKQALVEGATRVPKLNMYEQGQGKINVLASKEILANYVPRASIVPASLNLTDAPFMWPFSSQPLYAGAMPIMFNATVLNGMGLTGKFEAPPVYAPTNPGGQLLDLRFEYSSMLWPWSGFLALYIRVKPEGATFNGTATGEISFTIASPPPFGEKAPRTSKVTLPITAAIIPTPPRHLRVLWDQFHSIRYPPAYFPRDDLQVRHDVLDWHGDHPHTNFHDMYNYLRNHGYFLEVLASPITCFNASQYGALMIVDSEDEFYQEEISKLEHDIRHLGLGLLIFADWYDVETMHKLRFYDDNTRSWWEAATGGANVPALNDLLTPYGAALGSGTLDGDVQLSIEGDGQQLPPFKMATGTRIAAFPAGGHLHKSMLAAKQGSVRGVSAEEAILGLLSHGTGRLALYGDSSCLDSSHQRANCYDLLRHLLGFATEAKHDLLTPETRLTEPFGSFDKLPLRRDDYNFTDASPVLQTPLKCYPNSPLEYHGKTFLEWRYNVSRPAQADVLPKKAPGNVQGEEPKLIPAGAVLDPHAEAAKDTAAVVAVAAAEREQPKPADGAAAAAAAAGGQGEQEAQGGLPKALPRQGAAGSVAGGGGGSRGAAQGAAGAAGAAGEGVGGAGGAVTAAEGATASTGGAGAGKGSAAAGEEREQQQRQQAEAGGREHPDIAALAQAGTELPGARADSVASLAEAQERPLGGKPFSSKLEMAGQGTAGAAGTAGGGAGAAQALEIGRGAGVLERSQQQAAELAAALRGSGSSDSNAALGGGRPQQATQAKLEGGGPGLVAIKLPPRTITSTAQLFAVLGALAVAGLWTLSRRRRAAGLALLITSPRRRLRSLVGLSTRELGRDL